MGDHHWYLYNGQRITEPARVARSIHRLRCIDLGWHSFDAPKFIPRHLDFFRGPQTVSYIGLREVARQKMLEYGFKKLGAQGPYRNWRMTERAAVIARNVRLACDADDGSVWGLTPDQVKILRCGKPLTFTDSFGEFEVGYVKK